MKTLVLGDVHGRWMQAQQTYEAIIAEEGTPDLLIQVGDLGFWPRIYNMTPWDFSFDHPCWWIDGNHEDHEVLLNLHLPNWGIEDGFMEKPLEAWKGFMDRWEYKSRGHIHNGCLFIGGARSVDQAYRTTGVDWFREENISYAQQQSIYDAILEYGPENIHTVFSHDSPGCFDVSEACVYSGVAIVDGNRKFLQSVLDMCCPNQWFFGHYHKAMEGVDTRTGCKWRCIDMIRPDQIDYVMLNL